MAVQEPDGTEQILSADRFVLTTGARARPLPFPGNEHVTVSDDFFELEPLPRRILFLGGGFISMEFAHIASPYGSECHIVERRDHILTGFESFLTEKLLEHSIKHHGISIHLNSEVESIKRQQDGLHVQLTSSRQSIIVDAVIHGAGRIPNIEELDLAAGEVEATAHGIQVDEYFNSTTNPRVYAAGDCADTGVPHLTLVAGAEGSIVYRNLVEGNTARADYRGIATIVFTLPQMASVGMTEHDARAAELDIELREQDTARWFTNRILNWGVGGFKIIIDRDSDRLLGAHFLGHECEEFINVFALAIRHGITREELKQTLWGHPSNGSDMRRILGTQS
jgi:glutathione reductase (NADPH)